MNRHKTTHMTVVDWFMNIMINDYVHEQMTVSRFYMKVLALRVFPFVYVFLLDQSRSSEKKPDMVTSRV